MAATRKFAEGTSVAPETSQQEINRLLRRYGASGFALAWEDDRAAVAFRVHDRQVRFDLRLPSSVEAFARTEGPNSRRRTPAQAEAALEAEVRRLWRALALAIKAKLEVVESGIATFDEEFMSHIVLPDGSTFAQHAIPAIAKAYAEGGAPALGLPAGRSK